MRIVALALAFLAVAEIAKAQEPKFAPYTIDQQTHTEILNYLGEIPAKYANPLISALQQKAQRAAAEAS